MDLIHLPVRTSVPSLGSHRFVLRSGSRIEEIAILIDDVLYYTLPCIAGLVFPDPAKWKKSWETVYRSLMPHRHNIIQDEDRVRSVSELPATRPPHGNPGAWTTEVINEIVRGQAAARAARCSARRLREVLAVHPEDQADLLPVSAHQEGFEEQSVRDPLNSPLSHVANYLTTFARSRSRRSSGRTTLTSTPPSAS